MLHRFLSRPRQIVHVLIERAECERLPHLSITVKNTEPDNIKHAPFPLIPFSERPVVILGLVNVLLMFNVLLMV